MATDTRSVVHRSSCKNDCGITSTRVRRQCNPDRRGCACPDNQESAGINYSHRCPKGNRQMRRVLNQAPNAAVRPAAPSSPWSISPARAVAGLCTSDRRHHPLALLIDLEDPHERVRCDEPGAVCQDGGEEGPRAQDDPRTEYLRLPRRADHTRSISVSDDFRPWIVRAA